MDSKAGTGGFGIKVNKWFRLHGQVEYEIRKVIHVTVMLFAPSILTSVFLELVVGRVLWGT